MEIAVCDDDSLDRNTAARFLRQSLTENKTGGGITCFSYGTDLLYEFQDGKIFDLIFLDIYMDKLMGIDVARQLRRFGYKGHIVFLTASKGFAVEGYEVRASGYLVKPVSYEKISSLMSNILHDFNNEIYQFRRRSEIVGIAYNDIVYVESCNSKCLIHCSDGECYTVYKRLCDIEDELDDRRFLRCHQSYLINMNRIVHAAKCFETDTGETVLIRQKSLKEIRDKYYEYLSGL